VILVAGGIGISWNPLQAVGEVHAPPSRAAIAVLRSRSELSAFFLEDLLLPSAQR
jgi:hypothetical protein